MNELLGRLVRPLVLALLLFPVTSHAGFFIQNGRLMDDNGVPFVMRGINYPFAWFTGRYPAQTQQDFANMAATGANTVRIVLGTGGQYPRNSGAQISQLIQWCKDNRMIAVLEVHDSTGWSEAGGAVPISNAVAYWTNPEIRSAIDGQEDFVIVNIANEPFGNNTTANFIPDTIGAITALRNAGLTHNIMIDAANWGQDWSNTMRTNAQQLWNADPQRNLTFSVHMYEVYQNATTIANYLDAFVSMGLPLVVGEFGTESNGQNVDEVSVMAQTQQRAIGYLAWSWSGNSNPVLDMVTNFSTTLSTWGNTAINDANGIRRTAVPATVFAPTGTNLTVSPTAITFGSNAGNSLLTVTSNVSWTATDSASWLALSPTAGSGNSSITVSATANTGTASRSGTITLSGGGLQRMVSVTQSAAAQQLPPAAPAGLTATAGNAQVSLRWNASTGATSYNVKRSTTNGGPYTNVATGVTATSFTNTALTNGTPYFYVVSAVNANGESQNSTQASATPQATGNTGAVTVTRTSNLSPWYNEEQVVIANTSPITALTITIVMQRTPGVSYQGMWNTVGSQIQHSNSSTTSAITYQFTLAPGQTLGPSSNRQFVAQASGTGTPHPAAGDTYTVTYTTGGVQGTQSGTF
jgi:mannan endo-1,4-beta-mannosidase